MYIHNIMEEKVLQYLEEITSVKEGICKCEHCKVDMACYALNRVRPMYVASSRGIIHTENKKREFVQEEIDIYSIVVEAIEVVTKSKRHDLAERAEESSIEVYSRTGNYFNFPQIVGRIFDSSSILPIEDAVVTLISEEGPPVEMYSKRWNNPLTFVPAMKGTYTFWPAPTAAEKSGIQKDFQFVLEVKKNGFELSRKYFVLTLISSREVKKFIKNENIFYINDIFISPEGAIKTY